MGWRLRADATGFRFFIPDAALAQNARAIFRRYLEAHATPDSDLYGAELIFGELIANVARHAPGELETNLSWVEGDAVLEVRDRGDGFTLAVALPGDEYGSQLVHERDAEGSRVRVTLPVRRRERGRPSRGRPLIG
jgi:anti-sigma regulatory factor (Ser/Thr protein kinase)